MPTIAKVNPTFNDLASFHGEFLFNEEISDAGSGEEMPDPLTWNTASPVGEIDWSAFTVAVDAAGINRSNRAGATLISPSYCVYAEHAPGDNIDHTWMTPGGVEVNRTLGNSLGVDLWKFTGSDLAVAKLSAPINNISPMPILADCSKAAGKPCLVLEMDRHLNIYNVPANLTNDEDELRVTQFPGEDYIEGGDSGKPVMILIDGVAVMLMTAMFASAIPDGVTYTGIGPNASHYIDDINAILDADGEELTLWDVRLVNPSTTTVIRPSIQVAFSPSSPPLVMLGV